MPTIGLVICPLSSEVTPLPTVLWPLVNIVDLINYESHIFNHKMILKTKR